MQTNKSSMIAAGLKRPISLEGKLVVVFLVIKNTVGRYSRASEVLDRSFPFSTRRFRFVGTAIFLAPAKYCRVEISQSVGNGTRIGNPRAGRFDYIEVEATFAVCF